MYKSQIVKQANTFTALILVQHLNSPNYDVVKETDVDTYEIAQVWIDDEIARLETGKGVWE